MALWLLFVIAGICASNGNPATVDHPLVYGNFAIKDKEGNVITQLAADLTPAERLVGKSCKSASNGNNVVECLEWDNGRKVEVLKAGPCMIVRHQFESKKEMLTTVDFGGARWFGGGEEIPQKWPLDKHVDLEHSMVTQEAKNRAIQDAVWFSSSGVLLHVKPGAPLFLKWNSTQEDECKGKICFRYIDQDPYRPRPGGIKTEEWFCSLGDAKKAFEFAVDNIYGKPTGYPDERMIKYPVWSTWAKFKAEINDSAVRSFADDIIRNGFTNGQFELDDMWETCYGSKIVDTKRFPDLKKLTLDLKAQNFRVTIWTHPFINTDCPATFNEAKDKGFLTKDMNGNVVTKWWNGVGGIVDFSKPDATDWFAKTHKQFLEDYGIDGFKFDAGETSWFPQLPDLSITPSMDEEYPNAVTASYVRMCATFNSLTEVRSAYYTQNLPIFLRMVDKDSRWGDDNGLKSLVTTLLQMNMVGYSLVLPDMIGGNAYNGEYADQELFLRWLEANTFMPALQYALVPWDYGDKSAETVQISKKFTDLHAEYSDIIIKAMQKNVADGSPVNPPIWWLDPADESALAEDTEYLVGEEILVAPVLEQGAVSRDIYLPKGSWRDMNNKDQVYHGPTTIVGYKAPLDTLPWFVIVGSDADKDVGNSGSSSKLAPTVVSLLCLWYSLTMFR